MAKNAKEVRFVLTCIVCLVAGIGCADKQNSDPLRNPKLWLEVRMEPGYPIPGEASEPLDRFEVTRDGKVTHFVDQVQMKLRMLSRQEIESLESLVESGSHVRRGVPMHVPLTWVEAFRDGRKLWSTWSFPGDAGMPNEALQRLKSYMAR